MPQARNNLTTLLTAAHTLGVTTAAAAETLVRKSTVQLDNEGQATTLQTDPSTALPRFFQQSTAIFQDTQ